MPAPEDPLVLQGKWLREQLTERGWTAEQLVQEAQAWAYRNGKGEIGMTRSYVSEWLGGKRGISVRYAEILAGVFGVPASQFVDSRALSAQGRLEALADKGESIVLRRNFGRLVGAGALVILLPQDPFGSQLTRPEDDDPTRAIREQLMRYDSISGPPATSVDTNLAELQRRVNRAWQSFQSSRYSALGRALPGLLTETQVAAEDLDGERRLVAASLLSETYQLAAIMLLKQGDSNLAWVAADRGMLQAERSENLLTIAGGARILAYAALDARHHATARDLCVRAAERLEPGLRTGSPEYLSAYGALLLKAAIASAKQGDRSGTQELLDEAASAGQRLGHDNNYLWTAFGPTNVAVHRVSAALELGDGGTAVEFAKAVRPAQLPVLERRAHHLLDIARGYGLWGKTAEATRTLLVAEKLAPEEVRIQPGVRTLVAELLHKQPRHIPELRALAGRIGAVA